MSAPPKPTPENSRQLAARYRWAGWAACSTTIKTHPGSAAFSLALLFSTVLLLGLDRLFPPPIPRPDGGLVVLAQDGTPLRAYPSQDGVWRHPVSPAQVSPHYLQAVLTYEDRWFYHHAGVNPFALLRAAGQWLWHGRIVSGGSTLSMQVARLLEPQPRSLAGKLRQMARAMQLEWHLDKAEILTLYLNRAPMGGIVEGVEMASRAYLGKSAANLSPAEAALLAALPQAPSRLRPDRYPQRAEAARNKVLQRMAALKVWTPAAVADARIERVVAQPIRAHWLAPLLAERLRQRAPRQAVVHSLIDREAQTVLENLLVDRVAWLPPRVSLAGVVMDNDTLAVVAYAGSADFADRQRFNHVDMVRGVRSPGSALKPFLYALALDGGLIHSESLLVDAPQGFDGYEPGNFQASFSGPVSVADALQRSLNVPAVDLLDRIGPARFAATLRAGGVWLRMPQGSAPNLSLILGGGGTTLEELVGAYRAFAREGMAASPRLTPDAPRREQRIMSPGAAWIVRDILSSGGRPDQAAQDSSLLAWKTGTSFGFRDAWAVGVTPRYTLGVWVGRPDGTPNPGFFGANTAAPLLRDIASALPDAGSRFSTRPASVGAVSICWPLGLAASATAPEQCALRRTAWTLEGAVPPTLPERHSAQGLQETVWLHPANGLQTHPGCQPDAKPLSVARWPTLLLPWLDGQTHVPPLPAWQPGCTRPRSSRPLQITGLEPGQVLRFAPHRNSLTLTVRAEGSREATPLYWLLNGALLAGQGLAEPGQIQAPGAHSLRLTLQQRGPQTLTVMDGSGNYAQLGFVVQ